MAEKTGIGWTDATFSPWWGCTKVSPGCKFCYAEVVAAKMFPARKTWGSAPRLAASENYWREPERWNRKAEKAGIPLRVFCSSMADVFEENMPAIGRDGTTTTTNVLRERLWGLIARTPWLDWLLLTKRPESLEMLPRSLRGAPNIWLGTSVESQHYVHRIDELMRAPAFVRFVSIEPLLGPVDLDCRLSPLTTEHIRWPENDDVSPRDLTGPLAPLHWIITGGESGGPDDRRLVERNSLGQWSPKPEARAWVRALRDQALAYGVSFFHKQWGGPKSYSGGDLLDGVQWKQMPASAPR